MSKRKKGWLTAAGILLAAGILVSIGSFTVFGFDLGPLEYERNTYEISEDFDEISIDESTSKISFAVSDDETCKVECFEQENRKHSADVQDGTLFINTIDTSKWYDQFRNHLGDENGTILVYLPKTEYGFLNIETDTSDVEIPDGFLFQDISITGDTSDITCRSSISGCADICTDVGDISFDAVDIGGDISIDTDTSDVILNTVNVGGTVSINFDTGTISLTSVNCQDLSASIDAGNIMLKNVTAKSAFSIEGDVCDVDLENCDAGTLDITTDTGDITGTLLSDKVFIVESAAGDIDVPKTTTGGRCEMTTDTGDIKISII